MLSDYELIVKTRKRNMKVIDAEIHNYVKEAPAKKAPARQRSRAIRKYHEQNSL